MVELPIAMKTDVCNLQRLVMNRKRQQITAQALLDSLIMNVYSIYWSKRESSMYRNASIEWEESRRKWTEDISQRPRGMQNDPIISWSTTYEDLLSTNDPFPKPIPLPEMVDFLVDTWHDEGLFD
ncbi:hypothetical protein SASPL_125405 [Salvia splendens]|uniref:Gag1-like clamp domain-containing protein n=1 Tax=Salvia splendens TaxID=180675 RepID=A0A8X8XFG2_SALSN|nr:hypothetical protein SASPL_125405 [Salvia splendens]